MATRTIPLEGAVFGDNLTTNTPVTTTLSRAADGTPYLTLVTDEVAPTVSSGATNAAGSTITLTMSESMADVVPAANSIAITGDDATVASIAVSGTTVTLTLTGTIESGDTITIAYTAPATNGLRDARGNKLANFSGQAITNNSTA